MVQPDSAGATARVPSARAPPMIISRRVGRLIARSYYRGEQHRVGDCVGSFLTRQGVYAGIPTKKRVISSFQIEDPDESKGDGQVLTSDPQGTSKRQQL